MTMNVLLGFGSLAPRAGERGGKPAADGAAEAFGELIGKGDRKASLADRLGVDDDPRNERMGVGRELLGMYDLRLRQLGNGTAIPLQVDDEAPLATVLDEPQGDMPELRDHEKEHVDDDAAPGQSAATPAPDRKAKPARTATDVTPDQVTADQAGTAGDAPPADVAQRIVDNEPVRDDTSASVATEDAGLQSRVAAAGRGAPGDERNQRASRVASAAPQQQNGPAAPAHARAEPVPAGEPPAGDAAPVQRPQPAPGAGGMPDVTTADDGSQRAPQQGRRAGAAAGVAANAPASEPADPFAGRVKIVGSSTPTSPPPALVSLLGPTSASVVAAIEADPAWRAAAAEMASSTIVRTPNSTQGVNTLRIQLNPAELGMVTARLTATGSQLSIEIQVESNDARQRLVNDSDAIVKALRSVGLEVDRITIQQSATPSTGAGQQAAGGRDQQFAGQQAGDGNGRERGDGRQAGSQNHDDARPNMAERAGGRSDGNLYI